MPKFAYTATNPNGNTVKGVEEALTIGGVRRLLLERDLSPVDVKEKRNVLQVELKKKKVKRRDLMHFSRQMAVFVHAGIPLLETLDVMTEELGNKDFAVILAQMADSLRGGATFAGAAAEHPEAFPSYYIGILESAELTGSLDTVLDQLADYIERDIEATTQGLLGAHVPGYRLLLGDRGGCRHHGISSCQSSRRSLPLCTRSSHSLPGCSSTSPTSSSTTGTSSPPSWELS